MICKTLKHLGFLFLIILYSQLFGQNINENIRNNDIYDFLDEIANDGIIELSSVVKPYTRDYIAEKLQEALSSNKLNNRQLKEATFFFTDFSFDSNKAFPDDFILKHLGSFPNTSIAFNPPGIYYADTLFRLAVRPVLGYSGNYDGQSVVSHRFVGASAFAHLGKHLSVYTSLTDNNEYEMLSNSLYLTPRQGANYKTNLNQKGRNDYSDMRGGIVYHWKWGGLGLVKDDVVWGNNYSGANIFSGHSPSFAHIKFFISPVKWFRFNYFHGWLVSGVIDSSRSYFDSQNVYRGVFHEKYLAANMFTLTPFKRLDISFGNSMIYSDIGLQPAYLIPFMFFKSIDHTLNSVSNNQGQNAQMFFDISSRQIKHTHLFASLFVDEIKLSTMFDEVQSRNQLSFKAGVKVNNLPKNTFFVAEYTRTNPWAYRHYISTTTFTSNFYTLGHYLRDNAELYNFSAGYRPLRGLCLRADYSMATKGEEYPHILVSSTGTPFLDKAIWENTTAAFSISYLVFNNIRLNAGFTYSDTKDITGDYTPNFYKGIKRIYSFGLSTRW